MKLHSHQILATVGSGVFALGIILSVKGLWYVGIPLALVGITGQVLGLITANKFRNRQG